MSEHAIQNAIRNALAGECLAFRANVGSAWAGQVAFKAHRRGLVMLDLEPGDIVLRKARPFSTGLPKGFSDLFGLVPGGRFFALEVKAERGRTHGNQDNFLAAVERNGGIAGVVRSPDDARRILGLS